MRMCSTTGKTMYNNLKEAQKGLIKLIDHLPNYNGEPYFCIYCSYYHFGRKKKPKSKK
jgi:hypothetical protein